MTPRRSAARFATVAPPEALFVLSGISMYLGAAVAVHTFDDLGAVGVAWWRVCGAGVILLLVRRSWRAGWTGRQVLLAGLFGTVLAGMNTSFYLAIDRLPLGTTVAIEFIGPVAVAAVGSRTRRSWLALLMAAGGVAVLADVQLEASASGLAFALAAAVLWAGYIVLGAKVASEARAVDGLTIGLLIGAVALAPVGFPDAARVVGEWWLLVPALGTAVLSNVIPYGIDQVVLRRIPRARFALLLALLPVTATVVGLAALRQTPSWQEAAGIALVVVGIAVSERRARPGPDAVEAVGS
ncbi:MAG: EamA family transporter [Actinobacteria bacterium]|nr:EamA family transporter [Actinomycetota bacterium]